MEKGSKSNGPFWGHVSATAGSPDLSFFGCKKWCQKRVFFGGNFALCLARFTRREWRFLILRKSGRVCVVRRGPPWTARILPKNQRDLFFSTPPPGSPGTPSMQEHHFRLFASSTLSLEAAYLLPLVTLNKVIIPSREFSPENRGLSGLKHPTRSLILGFIGICRLKWHLRAFPHWQFPPVTSVPHPAFDKPGPCPSLPQGRISADA